jgi:hypothetical protein
MEPETFQGARTQAFVEIVPLFGNGWNPVIQRDEYQVAPEFDARAREVHGAGVETFGSIHFRRHEQPAVGCVGPGVIAATKPETLGRPADGKRARPVTADIVHGVEGALRITN